MKWAHVHISIITLGIQTVLFGGCHQAVTVETVTSEPLVAYNNGQIHFGEIDEGRSIEATYTIVNASTTEMIIDGVRSGCGCTIPKLEVSSLAPGESLSLPVRFNSKGNPGEQDRVVTMYYYPVGKQDETHLLNLTLSGYVRTRLYFSSRSIQFGVVHVGEVYEQEFTVSSDLHPAFEISGVNVADSQIATTAVRLNENTFKVSLALRPNAESTESSSTLSLDFQKHPTSKYNILVNWKPYVPVEVFPPSIMGQRTGPVAKATITVSPREPTSKLAGFSPVLNYRGGTVREIDSSEQDTRIFELLLPRNEDSTIADTGFIEFDWHEEDTYSRLRVPIAITR